MPHKEHPYPFFLPQLGVDVLPLDVSRGSECAPRMAALREEEANG
jgi:hypothetical protein